MYFLQQGIDGLPGEKADKGSKGEPGLNVCNIYEIYRYVIFIKQYHQVYHYTKFSHLLNITGRAWKKR